MTETSKKLFRLLLLIASAQMLQVMTNNRVVPELSKILLDDWAKLQIEISEMIK